MPRRIDVELTSSRDDGTWTWRAAGRPPAQGRARRGAAAGRGQDRRRAAGRGRLRHRGHHRGGGRRAQAGPAASPSGSRSSAPSRDEQLVTTTLVGKRGPRRRPPRRRRDGSRRPRRDRGDRGPRPPPVATALRPATRRARRRPPARGRPAGRRSRRPARASARPPRPEPEARPKAKRLRAGRVHRNEVMASLPEEQKPIAEQVLRGGIPAVRQAVDKQNEAGQGRRRPRDQGRRRGVDRRAAAPPPAHRRVARPGRRRAGRCRRGRPAATCARWWWPPTRPPATRRPGSWPSSLREALTRRVEQEHAAWLAEIAQTLTDGRAVRALRLSSRPPKAGAPLPPDLAARLAEAASASLTAETGPDRFATVLDALAYSPVRGVVVAQGVPAEPGDALLAVVRKFASPPAPDRHRLRDRGQRRPRPAAPAAPSASPLPRRGPTPRPAAATPGRARTDRSRASARAEPRRGRAADAVAGRARADLGASAPSRPPEAGGRPSRAEVGPGAEPRTRRAELRPSRSEPQLPARPARSWGRASTRSPASGSARGFQPARAKRAPTSRAQARSWAGVAHEHDLVRPRRPSASSTGPQPLGPLEGVAEQGHLGRPPQPGQLGPARPRVLVRAHRPRGRARPRSSATPAKGWAWASS